MRTNFETLADRTLGNTGLENKNYKHVRLPVSFPAKRRGLSRVKTLLSAATEDLRILREIRSAWLRGRRTRNIDAELSNADKNKENNLEQI